MEASNTAGRAGIEQQGRIEGLDQLRGLAALTVVFHHCLLVFPAFFAVQSLAPSRSWLVTIAARTPLHLLWAGTEAVILFFVLSGFVLALPYLAGRSDGFLSWASKRVGRIYIPYITAISASVVFLFWIGPHTIVGGSTWLNGMWSTRPTWKGLVDLIVMGGRGTHNVDTAAWSLVHEMRISLLFPLIMPVVKKVGPRASLVGAGILSLIGYGQGDLASAGSWWQTVFYASFFILGAVVAQHRVELIDEIKRLGRSKRFTLVIAATVLYLSKWIIVTSATRIDLFSGWMVALGSLLLILCAAASAGPTSLLNRAPLIRLGQISYSLYLTHAIVLLLIVRVIGPLTSAPLPALVAIVPPASIAFAAAFHRLIEAPSTRLGRHMALALARRKTQPVALVVEGANA